MSDDPRILRVITVGLILAALAVGYFIITGGLGVKPKKAQTPTTQVKGTATVAPTPLALGTTQPTSSPEPSNTPTGGQSAYDRIASRTQSDVQTLPNTGFPAGLAVVFSLGTLISGWSLRKYPN